MTRVEHAADRVHLLVCDAERPDGFPVDYATTDRVCLAARDLLEPDPARPGLAPSVGVRRGAAIALLQQIRARSSGQPPATGRVVAVVDVLPGLAGIDSVERLVWDVDDPAVHAILALFVQVRHAASGDSGDVVEVVRAWFTRLGLDLHRSLDQLDGHLVTSSQLASGGEVTTPGDPCDVGGLVDLDRVAELVRAHGVECVIDTPGGGVAVLLAGAPAGHPSWAFPWAAQAGPGRFEWDRPSTARLDQLHVGPDTAAPDLQIAASSVGAVTAEQVAALVLAQVRCPDPDRRLTVDELAEAGLHRR